MQPGPPRRLKVVLLAIENNKILRDLQLKDDASQIYICLALVRISLSGNLNMKPSQTALATKDRPSDPRNREVVYPSGSDPQIGNLETPINASNLAKKYLHSLSAYRDNVNPVRRGLEVGIVHGLIVFVPFATLGPLRDTDTANLVGLLSSIGLILISAGAIVLYAMSHPPKPVHTITTPDAPREFHHSSGWSQYALGFLFGGVGGSALAYFIFNTMGM